VTKFIAMILTNLVTALSFTNVDVFVEQTGLWFLEKQVLMELPKVVLIIAYRGHHLKDK
jgi:hypothetical protein